MEEVPHRPHAKKATIIGLPGHFRGHHPRHHDPAHFRPRYYPPPFPFAKKRGQGTSHALVVLKTGLLSQLNYNIPTTACLLDIQKAVDAV